MLNVKHSLEGRNLRDKNCDPIRSVVDHQLDYFRRVIVCLDVWEAMSDKNRSGVLTRETMSALRHTLLTIIAFSKYLLEQLILKYVLTGKFQAYFLEYRFAQYRRLAGTNYHVSVREIIQDVQDLLAASSKNCDDVSLVAEKFSGAMQIIVVDSISEDDMHVLVFIAGFVGRKLENSLSCTACVDELISLDDMSCDVKTDDLVYVHALDRGGLKWPRQALVDIVTIIFCLFQRLLCSDYEKQFIAVPNHKQLGVYLSGELLQSTLSLNCVCEAGHDTMQDVFKPCASKMANILLNNYCKRLNDACITAKGEKSKKGHKLATITKS